jgi:hypothetical protein
MMIVKLQWPLDGDGPVFVYDQHRMHKMFLPQTPELDRLFGKKLKIYAEAELSPAGELVIGKRVRQQEW